MGEGLGHILQNNFMTNNSSIIKADMRIISNTETLKKTSRLKSSLLMSSAAFTAVCAHPSIPKFMSTTLKYVGMVLHIST